jgi:hypothetical protein
MTQFMRRVNPVSRAAERPMFGPKIAKFQDDELVGSIELIEEAPKVVEEPVEVVVVEEEVAIEEPVEVAVETIPLEVAEEVEKKKKSKK